MKKARVIYNPDKDMYEIQINTGEGWGLDQAWKFVAKYGETDPENRKYFLHYGIIIKLAELQHQGYTVDLKTI